MEVNLNDTIRVKLTTNGQDIYYHQYDELNKSYGKVVIKPSYAQADSDGYSAFQLWTFIETFGKHIHMGAQNIIENNTIVINI